MPVDPAMAEVAARYLDEARHMCAHAQHAHKMGDFRRFRELTAEAVLCLNRAREICGDKLEPEEHVEVARWVPRAVLA